MSKIKASILVSMYNSKLKTINVIDKLFFPSLLKNASLDKEFVLLDDCSPLWKETKEMVEKYSRRLKKNFGRFIFKRNARNLGFAGSYNRAVSLAKGETLLIANDDIYFPEGSINKLIKSLDKNKKTSVVAPITNGNRGWTYQYCSQAPLIKNYSKRELKKLEKFGKFSRIVMNEKLVEVDRITGFCFVIKRDLMKKFKGFNEDFKYGCFEDTDLMSRIAKKHKILVHAGIFVHHGCAKERGATSILQNYPRGIYYFLRNMYKYYRIWGYKNTSKVFFEVPLRFMNLRTVSPLFNQEMRKRNLKFGKV